MRPRARPLAIFACLVAIGCAGPGASGPISTAADSLESSRGRFIDRDRAAVVLIDAQPTFWGWMAGEEEPVMARTEQLLALASFAEIPTIATFEFPTESNGWLPERLEKVFPEHGLRFVKRTFNCCREPEIRAALESLDVDQIILAGAETDVCVLQSAMGFLDLGYEVFLLEDCLFTNEPNTAPALRRMYDAGIIPCTFKTFFFEVTRTVDRSAFPASWRERRRELGLPFRSPYDLPPSEAPR